MEWSFDFYFDFSINMTHVEDHGISLKDIYVFFESGNFLEKRRKDGCFEAVGILKTKEIKVVYRKLSNTKKKKHYFIITAYEYELTELDHLNLEEKNDEN